MIRLLLVDHDERVRRGWRMRLSLEEDLQVIAEAGGPDEALRLADLHRPDVILLDLGRAGASRLAVIGRLRALAPAAAVIVITTADDETSRQQALAAGAAAFVSKQQPFDRLLQMVREICHRPGAAV